MRELHLNSGSIFEQPTGDNSALCVTTNGMIKKNGEAVMGAGIAKAVCQRYGNQVAITLAKKLKEKGNHTHALGYCKNKNGKYLLFSFPTKHDWKDQSDINLIIQSANELVQLCNNMGIKSCFLPRPGCSNGKLNWDTVKTSIAPILDDRFIIVTQSKFD